MTQGVSERASGPLLLADLVEDDDHHHDHGHAYDRHSVPGRATGGSRADRGWYPWHAPYDDLESEQTERLGAVQDLLVDYLDGAPSGRLRAVSVCAGQARDLLPILVSHPRGPDVSATLIELDPLNASFLEGALASTALSDLEVVVADAGLTSSYVAAAPADLVVVCGVLPNLDRVDAGRTVSFLPALCVPGAVVVWSSYGDSLADADRVLALLEGGSFERIALRTPEDGSYVVAAHRFCGPPATLPPDERIFTFRPA